MFTLFVFICYTMIAQSADLSTDRQNMFERITKYELIHFNLDAFPLSNIIEFNVFNKQYSIQLKLNQYLSPKVRHFKDNKVSIKQPSEHKKCRYNGNVLNSDDSTVILSMCPTEGIHGKLTAFGEILYIYPMAYFLDPWNVDIAFNDAHIIYKHTDYDHEGEAENVMMSSILMDNNNNTETAAVRRRRMAQYNSGNNVVELYTVVEPTFFAYFDHDYNKLYAHLQGVISSASSIYEDNHWGSQIVNIKIKWVQLDIFQSTNAGKWDKFSRPNKGNALDKKRLAWLEGFTNWGNNYADADEFDYGYLFAIETDAGNGGYSYVGSICRDSHKYGIEVNIAGMTEAICATVLAHELGHNLGANHDTEGHCKGGGIMGGPQYSGWSSCSENDIKAYFKQKDGLKCLKSRYNGFEKEMYGNPPNNNNNNNYGSSACCDCKNNPSKSSCNSQCQNAVKGKDAWCAQNTWDGTCQNHAKKLCQDSGASGSSNDGSGSSDGGSSSGTCCECKSFPSKTNCNSQCENAVKGKDAWCAKNKWDGTCENHAKKICSNSFTECQGYNTAYHSLCFYKEGEAQLDEAGKFEVVQCIDNHGFASYQYIEYSMFNETESRTEYWLHFDSQTSQWIISEDMISIYGEYVCDERDILQCTAGKWKVSYIDIDAVMFINDDNAVIVSCQGSAQHNTVNNGVAAAVFIVLVFVAVALALIIFGMLIFCQTKQKQKRKIGDAQMVAMRDDDGCACDETNKNMRETIEVEMDPLTH